MDRPFLPVSGPRALDELLAQSAQRPVIVFKHDRTCPISRAAHQEMAQMADDVTLIDVAREQDVSLALAEQVGVEHASPQVLILRDGQAVWSASHYDITHAAVTRAIHQAQDHRGE